MAVFPLSYHIREEEKMILFSVTDTGIGIPIEKQESVFERFNKLDTFMPGTGLGLSISRLIAEKMGGSLTIVQLIPQVPVLFWFCLERIKTFSL